jgi:hypothetical protein
MFVLCPHCQFLVGVDPRTGRPPVGCPKCGQPMEAPASIEVELVPELVPEVVPDVAPDVVAEVLVEPAPIESPRAEPAPTQPSADDFIAAMAQKAPRKPRTKTKEIVARPAAEKPTRRKRAQDVAPEAASESTSTPAPAAAPARAPKPAGPSLAARIVAWTKSLKPAPKPRPAPSPAPATTDAAPTEAPERKKATVKPVPSLRERAAKRAPAADAPVETTLQIEATAEAATPAVPTEVATLAPTAVETALATELPPIVVEPRIQPIVRNAPLDIAHVGDAIEPGFAAPQAETAPSAAPAPAPSPPPKVTPPLARRGAPAPSFARTGRGLRAAMPARWTSFAALGALSLLLAVQLLLAQRDALASQARWRPTISALCAMLRCDVPAWHQPDAFTMLSRDVRPHATAAGTLQIDASFRNDARWPQAWPRLVLSLSDIDGRVVGTRAFTAHEYLGDAAGAQPTLAPGQTAAVSLAVVEPAPGVVAFSFEFR